MSDDAGDSRPFDSLGSLVRARIERAFAGWEASLTEYHHMHYVERVWYGRLDEAVGIGLAAGIIDADAEAMYSERVRILDPSLWVDDELRRLSQDDDSA